MVSNSYWWIVAIGLLIIFFFWSAIISAQEKEYYDIIWQNNLFRELGWKPPNLKPKFELIGTLVGEKIRIAYVRNIKSNKISRLGVGSNYMNYHQSVFSTPMEEIEILREEVQTLCKENYLLKKEKKEMEELIQKLYKQIQDQYREGGRILHPKKEFA